MSLDDPHEFAERLRRERRRLREADIADADRNAIEDFLLAKDGDCAISTLKHYSQMLRKTAEAVDGWLIDADLAILREQWRTWRDDGEATKSTIGNYQKVARLFFDHRAADWSEDISPNGTTGSSVDATQMLTQDDIAALVDAADRQRDIALIEFLADTGARVGLTVSLRVGDVAGIDGDRATYTPNPNSQSLKGAAIKPYPIVDSQAALRSYLNQTHPRPDRKDVALFHRLRAYSAEDKGALSPSQVRRRLRDLAADAGVSRPVNPHNFRHSAVTRMYREGWSKQMIQHRVQWTLDTDMWDNYVHLHAEDLNEQIFATAGVADAAATADSPTRHPCGNCKTTLAPHHEYCPNCGAPATADGIALHRIASLLLARKLGSTDDPAEKAALEAAHYQLGLDPSAFDLSTLLDHDLPSELSSQD